MPQRRIKHIAMMAADTNKIAEFYKSAFGMREIMRRDKANPAIYLSDGYINLAILPNDAAESNNAPPGLHHFGFEVEDADAASSEALARGASQGRTAVAAGRFAEGYVRDPEGQRVDISAGGWDV
jgi:catechol 2,3-dioxygenase-like lactoylglutathione lyase family enzyme